MKNQLTLVIFDNFVFGVTHRVRLFFVKVNLTLGDSLVHFVLFAFLQGKQLNNRPSLFLFNFPLFLSAKHYGERLGSQ
jgi:hypothetical protein